MATTHADARTASRPPQTQPSGGGRYDTEMFLVTFGTSTLTAVAAVAAPALF